MLFDPYERTAREATQEKKPTYVPDNARPEVPNYQALIREVPRYSKRTV